MLRVVVYIRICVLVRSGFECEREDGEKRAERRVILCRCC